MIYEKVDWESRYQVLATLTKKMVDAVRSTETTRVEIWHHLRESSRLSPRKRGKCHLLRLKEDVQVPKTYNLGFANDLPLHFPKGTLIQAEISGGQATIYLDEDGNGFLHFPTAVLEEVELAEDEVDWDHVVCQG